MAVLLAVTSVRLLPSPSPLTPQTDMEDDSLPVPPVPPRIAQGADYEHCLALLATDPTGAERYAEAWEATGGGDGATHCRALARIDLGHPEDGAEDLEKLGTHSDAPAAGRATVYGQAGQAWLMAGDPGRAYVAATEALALTPDDVDLLIDRAVAAGNLHRYSDAVDDLNHALQRDPKRDDALVFRAAAWRHLNQLPRARADIETALTRDPDDAEALLERGILRERGGDRAGARADWSRIGDLAAGTATADLAQQNLDLLDAGPDQRSGR